MIGPVARIMHCPAPPRCVCQVTQESDRRFGRVIRLSCQCQECLGVNIVTIMTSTVSGILPTHVNILTPMCYSNSKSGPPLMSVISSDPSPYDSIISTITPASAEYTQTPLLNFLNNPNKPSMNSWIVIMLYM